MRVLAAADDSGSLKEIIFERGTDTSKQDAPQPTAINTHCEGSLATRIQHFIIIDIDNKKYIIAARLSGHICVYDPETFDLLHKFEGLASTVTDTYIALEYSFGLIYACTESGFLSLIHPNKGKFDKEPVSLSLKGPISTFLPHPKQNGIIAYGGKENDIKILSIFTAGESIDQIINKKSTDFKLETVFEGKNVKNDKLDLRVPIWISKILFSNPSEDRTEPYHFITITRYGQLRKYNTGHGRKPVSDTKLSDKPLLTLSITKSPSEIICSDTHTTTAKFDIAQGRLIGKFSGAVGSIQSLYSCLPEATHDSGVIVTGGLDRYVRVFEIESRDQVGKIYLGTKISAVAVLEYDEKVVVEVLRYRYSKRVEKVKDEEESDEEEIWNKLENIEAGKSSKTKKRKV